MARSLSNAKFFAGALSRVAAAVVNRRGYAAGSTANIALAGEEKKAAVMMKKTVETTNNSWVPDPVTGYYRPANFVDEVDPAELRAILLSNKSQQ